MADASTTALPAAFGRYVLLDQIAVGGMAEIFRGVQFRPGGFERLVVIKRIRSQLSGEKDFIEMFLDEARISVNLTHPNIVQTFDFDQCDDHYYIAMEYLRGRDIVKILKALAQRRILMPVEFAAYIAHEVVSGLHYAHELKDLQGRPLGIAHRDVSPSNAIVGLGGDTKVVDFGIARCANKLNQTRGGVLKGKFAYMAPEQLRGQPADARSDLFSVGILLHEMLCSRRLFTGSSDVKTLENVLHMEIPHLRELNRAVPKKLEDLVLHALERDPAARFQTGTEFAKALEDFLAPTPLDVVKASLKEFMHDLFGHELIQEKANLELLLAKGRALSADGQALPRVVSTGRASPSTASPSPVPAALASAEGPHVARLPRAARPAAHDGGRGFEDGQAGVTGVTQLAQVLPPPAAVPPPGTYAPPPTPSAQPAPLPEPVPRTTGTSVPWTSPTLAAQLPPDQSPRRNTPFIAGVAGGALVLALIGAYFATRGEEHASLTLTIEPAHVPVRVFLDGVVVAGGTGRVTYDRITVDQVHTLRVEAGTGFAPTQFDLKLAEGQAETLPVLLESTGPAPAPAAQPAAARAPTPPVIGRGVRFDTGVVTGAAVRLDDAILCSPTPCTWSGGTPGQRYVVTAVRDGFAPARAEVTFPQSDSVLSATLQLQPLSRGAVVSVRVGGNLASGAPTLAIDGVEHGAATTLDVVLAPGLHRVTATDAAGARIERTVNVVEGTPATVTLALP